MLGLRLRIDCTQRSRNGQPAQSTTGTVSTGSIQVRASPDSHVRGWPNIASIITTNDSGSVHQKRRRKSVSSGFQPSSRPGNSGYNAMPKNGQVPGPPLRTPGFLGQIGLVPDG